MMVFEDVWAKDWVFSMYSAGSGKAGAIASDQALLSGCCVVESGVGL